MGFSSLLKELGRLNVYVNLACSNVPFDNCRISVGRRKLRSKVRGSSAHVWIEVLICENAMGMMNEGRQALQFSLGKVSRHVINKALVTHVPQTLPHLGS
jgi:hypothetical protein